MARASTSAESKKKTAPKNTEPAALVYPSPLLGVPAPDARSREIEIVFDRKSAEARRSLADGKQRLQVEAANKIAPLAQADRERHLENVKIYRKSLDAAERDYQRLLREAQSARDTAVAASKKWLEEVSAENRRSFAESTAPIERELKSSIYMLETGAADAQNALVEEFKTYHGAAKAIEEAKAKELEEKRLAAEKAAADEIAKTAASAA